MQQHRLPRLPIRQQQQQKQQAVTMQTRKSAYAFHQFSDNFMTLFRTELENYLVEQGFSKDNTHTVDGAKRSGYTDRSDRQLYF